MCNSTEPAQWTQLIASQRIQAPPHLKTPWFGKRWKSEAFDIMDIVERVHNEPVGLEMERGLRIIALKRFPEEEIVSNYNKDKLGIKTG